MSFQIGDRVTHAAFPGEVGNVVDVPRRIGLIRVYFDSGSITDLPVAFTLATLSSTLGIAAYTPAFAAMLQSVPPTFKVGDRVSRWKDGIFAKSGTVTVVDPSATPCRVRVHWDGGYERWEDSDHLELGGLPQPATCDCGAVKAKTTHTHWCSAHESGGTPPYKQPKERMF